MLTKVTESAKALKKYLKEALERELELNSFQGAAMNVMLHEVVSFLGYLEENK